jgi:hypothetical protein
MDLPQITNSITQPDNPVVQRRKAIMRRLAGAEKALDDILAHPKFVDFIALSHLHQEMIMDFITMSAILLESVTTMLESKRMDGIPPVLDDVLCKLKTELNSLQTEAVDGK